MKIPKAGFRVFSVGALVAITALGEANAQAYMPSKYEAIPRYHQYSSANLLRSFPDFSTVSSYHDYQYSNILLDSYVGIDPLTFSRPVSTPLPPETLTPYSSHNYISPTNPLSGSNLPTIMWVDISVVLSQDSRSHEYLSNVVPQSISYDNLRYLKWSANSYSAATVNLSQAFAKLPEYSLILPSISSDVYSITTAAQYDLYSIEQGTYGSWLSSHTTEACAKTAYTHVLDYSISSNLSIGAAAQWLYGVPEFAAALSSWYGRGGAGQMTLNESAQLLDGAAITLWGRIGGPGAAHAVRATLPVAREVTMPFFQNLYDLSNQSAQLENDRWLLLNQVNRLRTLNNEPRYSFEDRWQVPPNAAVFESWSQNLRSTFQRWNTNLSDLVSRWGRVPGTR